MFSIFHFNEQLLRKNAAVSTRRFITVQLSSAIHTQLLVIRHFNVFFLIQNISSDRSLLCYDFPSCTPLVEYLKNRKVVLSLDALFAVAMDLLFAIQYLEHKGVVHNNITTSSVLITRGLRVRLKKELKLQVPRNISLMINVAMITKTVAIKTESYKAVAIDADYFPGSSNFDLTLTVMKVLGLKSRNARIRSHCYP